jgi:hypothetical protein
MAVDRSTTVLFHVTPAYNVPLIALGMIDPSFSRGKLRASWYVSKKRICWAIAHTAARHSVLVEDLMIAAVVVTRSEMKRSHIKGMYYTYSRYKPETFTPAIDFLGVEPL